MNPTNQQVISNLGYRVDVCASMPKLTAEAVTNRFYGTVRGHGTTRTFSPLAGKTFKITDNSATITTEMTFTFVRANFVFPDQPTLAEIVVALNTYWAATSTVPPVASAGALGELKITSAAVNAAGVITIGAGTANEVLGFPINGYVTTEATGITIILPAEMVYPSDEFLYNCVPEVHVYGIDVATGILTLREPVVGIALHTWTPSTRTLSIIDGSKDSATDVRIVAVFG